MKKIILGLAILSSIQYNAFAQAPAAVATPSYIVPANYVLPVGNKKVIMETNMGKIVLELYAETPKHQANFLKLANEKLIDSTLFHRVIQGFMIQGGDVNSKTAKAGQMLGNGDLGYKVDAEFMTDKYVHLKGSLAAARDGNPAKASSSCQFYIVQGKVAKADELKGIAARNGRQYTAEQIAAYTTIGGTPFLDGEYTVFGRVLEGMDVVEKIAATKTGTADRPLEDVRIISVREDKPVVKKKKKFLGLF
jgi:cyclophilin family peptidyl-prolyl cis-trans isomerase